MSNAMPQVMSAFLNQAPLIVAYLAALVFCAMRWTRYPRPAQLAFLGTVFLLIPAIGQPILTQVIITQFRSNSAVQLGQMLSMVGFVASVIRATGFGFLVGAAFIHRQDPRAAFPFAPPVPRPPATDRPI